MTEHSPQRQLILEKGKKILVVGGAGVGKTSIINRLIGEEFPLKYKPTVGFEVFPYRFGTSTGASTLIDLWDVGSTVIDSHRSINSQLGQHVAGVLIVLDIGNMISVKDVDRWVYFLRRWAPLSTPTILLAHKADSAKWVVQPNVLEAYAKKAHFLDWFLTVGHPQYGDYDSRRGSGARQRTPVDVLSLLLKKITAKQIADANELETKPSAIHNVLPIESFSIKDAKHINISKKIIESNNGICQISLSDTDNNANTNKTALGWEYYGGVMTREYSENLLLERSCGSFLIRKSDLNDQLRIVIKTHDGTLSHVPVKKEDGSYRVGRPELRGESFETLLDALTALELYPSFGLEFRRMYINKEFLFEAVL